MDPFSERSPLLSSDRVMENERSAKPTSLFVRRPVYEINELNALTAYQYQPKTFKQACISKCHSCNPISYLFKIIPILYWLPRYNWKKNILGDILSGSTVAIMHIPQGMAYGIIGNLPPIVGIYMAFFPVLIYCLFGTSRHASIGTFAVVCLMTGKVVAEHSHVENRIGLNDTSAMAYSNIQVATTVTFAVGIFHLLMCIFRLGILTTLLSDTLVNAFTCAAAFHVVTAQLKDLFGLSIKKRRGLFSIIKTVYDVAASIPEVNITAVSMSAGFIIILALNNECFKPWLSKKTRIPIPIELIVITAGTVISYFGDMHNNYGLSIVGSIPTGLPKADLPSFTLLPYIAVDAFIIAIVSFTVTISMGMIVAQKLHYEVDANQELFALGWSNLFGSCFSCMPVTASLARTTIQESVGGVTQLASVVSCLLLLTVLLWIGPVFETLPRCVLGSIIVVALKGMLKKVFKLGTYWKLSKWDFLVWIVTFLTTVFVAIDIGLGAGILTSILTIFIQGYRPYTCLLGVVPNTDIYLDIERYKGVQEVVGIKIFHYSGSLNFSAKANFRSLLYKKVGFNPHAILTKRQEAKDGSSQSYSYEEEFLMKCVILDFAAVTYIDPSGVDMLRQILDEYKQLEIELYISSCSGPVFETLKSCDRYEGKNSRFRIFPSIHDAVLYAQSVLMDKYKGA